MNSRSGGCLCGRLRFHVTTPPMWVTICHCRFCQRNTGAPFMVEPIFDTAAFEITRGAPARHTHVSEGSGRDVHVHFCAECGARTHLTFARWPDRLGVFAGAFDAPGWFEISPATAKIIFIDSALPGTVIPAGYPTFRQHATEPDGTACAPVLIEAPLTVT